MKVNVTEKEKTSVALHSLSVGDGFLFDGYPHMVCESTIGYYKGFMQAVNLRNASIVALPLMQQVQPTNISVEYTV
ncbi:hypothetical protein KP12_238 [Klebsiella phage KP12]|jgi:hypothetical protein|uniref:Uncharacterized protein n=1 Tax=Klebsiella phage KP12 TaxID=2923374 RepID=A0A9E7CJ28_9CAUD|nr:hypothetical protein KP12_238 [Klebsiella phage KP12]